MSIVPLDLQRRCEQRWAARFARQAPEPSPQKHEKLGQLLGAPAKAKKENPPAQPRGLEIDPSGVSAGPKLRASNAL
jgi:hypothetical protein